MPSKTKLYLAIALGVLALILIAVVVIVYAGGGDVTAPAAGAAAVAAAAAEAARRHRNELAAQVQGTKEGLEAAGDELKENHDNAVDGMDAVDGVVASTTRDDKEREGEDAFKPSGST